MAITKEQANLLVAFATSAMGQIELNDVKVARYVDDCVSVKVNGVETWVCKPIITIMASSVWIESERFGVQIRIPIEEVEIC